MAVCRLHAMTRARIQFRVVDHDDQDRETLYRDVEWPQIPSAGDIIETGVSPGDLEKTKVESISWSIEGAAGVFLGELRLSEATSLRDFVDQQTARGWRITDA